MAVIVDKPYHIITGNRVTAWCYHVVAHSVLGGEHVGLFLVDVIVDCGDGFLLNRSLRLGGKRIAENLGEQASLRCLRLALQTAYHAVGECNLVAAYHEKKVVAMLQVLHGEHLGDSHIVGFKSVLLQEVGKFLFTALNHGTAVAAQGGTQACLALGCGKKIDPLGLWLLRVRREHFHLVAALQLLRQWHELMIHLAGNAVSAYLRVQIECHIEHRCTHRKGYQLAFWGENHNFARKKIELYGVEKIESIRLGILQNVLNGL